ncbi:hypothetical protein ACR2R6_01590 [Methylocaldum gracile subsp. desertum]|uniref:hypothetical protein n=1 Tax=Methylocaldum sp. GT1BW TaxID=3438964 RepID=UPI003D9FE9CA
MDHEKNHTDVDVQFTAKKDELSLKAKGAGLLLLIALSITGIILLSLKMAEMEKGTILFAPILFLLYITYNLIATLDAVLGLTVRYRDD